MVKYSQEEERKEVIKMTKVVKISSLDNGIYKENTKKLCRLIKVNVGKLRYETKQLKALIDDYLYYYSDKMTREGLFGEDKGKGYCGTDVDFIPEEAYDYRLTKKKIHIN